MSAHEAVRRAGLSLAACLSIAAYCSGVAHADLLTQVSWDVGPAFTSDSGSSHAATPAGGFNLGPDVLVGSASATANAGYLGLGTSTAFATRDTLPTAITEGVADATAESLDIFTPGGLPAGTSGFLVLTLEISGSNSAVLSATNPGEGQFLVPSGFGARTVLGIGGGSFSGDASLLPPLTGSFATFPSVLGGTFTFDGAEYDHVPIQVEFPLVYGNPFALYMIMNSNTGIALSQQSVAVTFAGTSSFGDTAAIVSVALLDSDHRSVSGASLASESGTLYPIAPTGVPEPDPIVLFGVALAVVEIAPALRSRARG